jgi:hypothetical protein
MTTRAIQKRKRGGGPRAIAQSITAATKAVFGKRGFADGAILKDWPTIAGTHLAGHSQPEKIAYPTGAKTGGTLHLTIDTGSMAIELQHLEPLLVERINGYFGFKAIDRLKVTQGPINKPEAKPEHRPRKLEPEEETDLADSLMEVDDPELRQALTGLGRSVMGRKPQK